MIGLRFFLFTIICYITIAFAQQDSLTAPVCSHPDQILAKTEGNKD
jgi:uncharacterized membrane protein YhhN